MKLISHKLRRVFNTLTKFRQFLITFSAILAPQTFEHCHFSDSRSQVLSLDWTNELNRRAVVLPSSGSVMTNRKCLWCAIFIFFFILPIFKDQDCLKNFEKAIICSHITVRPYSFDFWDLWAIFHFLRQSWSELVAYFAFFRKFAHCQSTFQASENPKSTLSDNETYQS